MESQISAIVIKRGNKHADEVTTYDFSRNPTILRVLFTPQVHKVQIDVEQRCSRCLQMFGLIWVALDLGDLVHGHMLLL